MTIHVFINTIASSCMLHMCNIIATVTSLVPRPETSQQFNVKTIANRELMKLIIMHVAMRLAIIEQGRLNYAID